MGNSTFHTCALFKPSNSNWNLNFRIFSKIFRSEQFKKISNRNIEFAISPPLKVHSFEQVCKRPPKKLQEQTQVYLRVGNLWEVEDLLPDSGKWVADLSAGNGTAYKSSFMQSVLPQIPRCDMALVSPSRHRLYANWPISMQIWFLFYRYQFRRPFQSKLAASAQPKAL